jgi:hypothetical protein
MRLSNLEEGSYNNAPEPKKMQVTVADKKANTEAWKRYQAGDSRYEFKNPTTEAEQEKAFLRRMQPGQPDIIEDAKGRDESVKNIDEILVKMGADAPSDIIADIMHWIDAHPGENLEDLIRQANGYYNDELEESTTVTEAGGYYTQPVYDMIKQHGYPKVMHELLTSLEADVIQDFISRADLDEGKSPHKKGTAKYKKHMAAMHAEGTHSDAKPIYDLVGSLGAGKIELADNPIFHNLVRFLDADTIEKFVAHMHKEMDNGKSLNEFGPDERYMKIGNNTMIANKKTGSVSSTLSLGGDKSATVNNHLNKDGSAGKVSARGTVNVSGNPVKFKASNSISGNNFKGSVSAGGMTVNASKEPKVREAGSPWTTTGKHPEKMTTDELWSEIAVFDHIQDRGERLTPKDMMRLDSLFSYMDTAEMNEQIKRKADSMMESAKLKENKNK